MIKELKIGKRIFDLTNHTYVMGILNVTPDSFSDGGKYIDKDSAIRKALQMIEEGADIIDIGGESSRPGYTKVDTEVQIERVIPVIEGIKKEIDIPISVDTADSKVALEAVKSGCDIINDIWALENTEEMARVAAEYNVVCILMHNKNDSKYDDFRKDILSDLGSYVQRAVASGLSMDKIILDPGVGFGKTYEQNLTAIACLDDLKDLGCPILLGTSRKSVIGLTLDLPVEERLEGTLATTVIACMKGINFVRVHDIKENVRAIKMTEAILKA